MGWVIAVHIGAGNHCPTSEGPLLAAMKNAIAAARPCLDDGADLLGACAAACAVLESCPFTNAGATGCLTHDGYLEGDASIVLGSDKSIRGSIAAIRSTASPIACALGIARRRACVGPRFPDGRPVPVMVCGGEGDCPPSVASVAEHAKWLSSSSVEDTVGVCVWVDGVGYCACSSSCGPLLRQSGRVGPAGVAGAACDASEVCACALSGDGESLLVGMSGSAMVRSGLTVWPEGLHGGVGLRRGPEVVVGQTLPSLGWMWGASDGRGGGGMRREVGVTVVKV